MAIGKKTGGRQPGTKNRKTIAKQAAKLAEVVSDQPLTSKRGGPLVGRKGISPKDLLLDSMRAAWDVYHEMMARSAAHAKDARALPDTDPAKQALVDKALDLRRLAGEQLELATDLAVKAAPYEHAKLANVDTRVRGNVVVKIAKF